MNRVILLLAAMLLCALSPAVMKAGEEGGYEMTTYYVGFLRKGPAWTSEETDQTRKIQEAHLAHMGRMAEAGDLLLAGPFMDDGDLRGMFVFRVDSIERARELADADPAVAAGRLVIDIHPWCSARGIGIHQGD